MSRACAVALLLAVTAALVLRAPRLDVRPLHNDEAVNAVKLAALWEKGNYAYDPDEFHGPSLYYASLPFLWLSGARDSSQLTDTTLRLAPIAFGIGLILLLVLLADGLGRTALWWAALFTAISPAMVFYSRYFIHETLLVFFTALVLGAGWRYAQSRRVGWALLGGAGLGLMYATKETFIVAVAALALAVIATFLWNDWFGDHAPSAASTMKSDNLGATNRLDRLRSLWNFKHALAALVVAFVVGELLFSSFLANPRGPLDSVRTYLPWLNRAGGASPHNHPWYFYLERLAFFHKASGPVWSEALILLLAAVGAVAALAGRLRGQGSVTLARCLTFYTVILTAGYCLISYKTPWCLLGFWHGMILLAGIGAAALVNLGARRWARIGISLVLALASAQLAWQAWRTVHDFASDPRNPYVYAQTVPDILRLVEKLEALAQIEPQGHRMVVKVIGADSDYWPLPWYLRRFEQVGWWDAPPDDPYAPIVIASSKLQLALDEKSDKAWLMAGLFQLRPANFLELYVQMDLWRKYVETLPRPHD